MAEVSCGNLAGANTCRLSMGTNTRGPGFIPRLTFGAKQFPPTRRSRSARERLRTVSTETSQYNPRTRSALPWALTGEALVSRCQGDVSQTFKAKRKQHNRPIFEQLAPYWNWNEGWSSRALDKRYCAKRPKYQYDPKCLKLSCDHHYIPTTFANLLLATRLSPMTWQTIEPTITHQHTMEPDTRRPLPQ